MPQAQAIPVAKPIAFNRYLALIYLTVALGLTITAVTSQGVYTLSRGDPDGKYDMEARTGVNHAAR
jgi:hypothetical protein